MTGNPEVIKCSVSEMLTFTSHPDGLHQASQSFIICGVQIGIVLKLPRKPP